GAGCEARGWGAGSGRGVGGALVRPLRPLRPRLCLDGPRPPREAERVLPAAVLRVLRPGRDDAAAAPPRDRRGPGGVGFRLPASRRDLSRGGAGARGAAGRVAVERAGEGPRPERRASLSTLKERSMRNARLLHYSHCVSNLERSRRFYVEVLGFEVVAEFDFDDPATAQVMDLPGCRFKGIFMKCDGMRIEIIGFSKPTP